MTKKKLYRVNNGKKIAGVCGGIAEYFNVSATAVRVLWVILALFAGFGLLAYLIGALVIPREP